MYQLTAFFIVLASCGCSAGAGTGPVGAAEAPSSSGQDYGPLEVGADYQSYTKVSTEPFESPTHGRRFVEIYVNDVGLAAYQGDAALPVGSVIVKTSWERDGDEPSEVAGPIFVMEKRAAGFDPERNDWYYALHWAKVPDRWAKKMGANQIYWRSPSSKVRYCADCHDNYDRELGLPAKGFRTWGPGQSGAK